jgi:hypothetical protein
MGAWGSLFDWGESDMAFMKNLRHSIMGHPPPRMIEEEPMEQRQQPHFQVINEKAKVGRWTSLPAAARLKRICR